MAVLEKAHVFLDPRPRAATALRRLTRRQHIQPIDPSPTTPVHRRPSVDFSLTGLVYCALMLFMGLAAINSQANLLFAVFGLMIGILIVSAMICRIVLIGLKVERVLPESAAVGQTATIEYRIENTKRFWPSFSVAISELDGAEAFTTQPQVYLLHAGPRRTATIPVELTPKRRGLHPLNHFQLSTSFPFGFIKRAMTRRSDDAILIFPAVGGVSPRLLSLCRSAERGGANMRPRLNGSDEFYGVKDFRTGENPRWIYWKRSARTGHLVSKEMVQISPPRLLILLDTFLESPTLAEHVAVEKAIAMAASLADRAMESGMAVGLVAWSGQWLSISAQRGKRHIREVMASLAGLPINRTVTAAQLIEHSQLLMRDYVTPVLFTPRDTQQSLGEQVRGAMITVAAGSAQAAAWFEFDPSVDFARSMPFDQARSILRPVPVETID